MTPFYFCDLGAFPAALAEGIIKDATSTELPDTETVTYTAATDGTGPQDATTRPPATTITVSGVEYPVLDLTGTAEAGRNIVCAVSHASSVVAMTVKVYGFDVYKMPMTETLSITATGTSKTATGAKGFRYFWKVEITAAANAEANTLDLSTGTVISPKYRIKTKNHVLALKDGVEDASATKVAGVTTTATSTTGDVRGTVDFATDADGTAVYALIIVCDDTSSATAVYGVTQA